MTDQITPERMIELTAKRDAGTLTEEEFEEMFGMTRDAVIAREQFYRSESERRSKLELSKPRAVVNVLDQILALEQGGGMRASEDKDWAVANTLEAAMQALMAFAQENAPGWSIRKVVSTLTLQMICTIQPGSQYNGIDYEEHWTGYDEDNGQRSELPDSGAGMIVDHLGSVMAKPEDYDMGHVLKPIGEHDFSYELPIAPKGAQLSPEFTPPAPDTNMGEWLADAFEYYLADPHQDFLKTELAAARAEHSADPDNFEYGPAFLRLRDEAEDYIKQGWLDDGMLRDAIGDALAPLVYGELKDEPDDTSGCEPNADFENPAGY